MDIRMSKYEVIKVAEFTVNKYHSAMAEHIQQVNIEDFTYDEDLETYFHPCSCGEKYEIFKGDLINGEDMATCCGCSMKIKIIYNPDDFQHDADTMPGESPDYMMHK